MSGKNKTLIFVISILVLFSVAILAVLNIQQEEEIAIFEEKNYENIKTSYANIAKKYESYYTDIIDNYFFSSSTKEIIRNKDKDALYKYAIKQYLILKKENTNLVSMKFYSPDNTLLLDMDNINNSSTLEGGLLVQKVHKLKKETFGAEQEEDLIVYKSVHPIFYAQEYLGAIEFAINIDYILNDMKSYSNISGAMFIMKKDSTSFELVSKTIQNMSIISIISKKSEYKPLENIETRKGVVYSVYTFYVKDYRGISIARLHFFNDTTKELKSFEENLNQIAIFLIAMTLMSIVVINSGVNRSLKSLQSSFENLADYTDMVDSNVMIVDTSVDGYIMGASKRFCVVSGYTQEELIGKKLESLKANEDEEELYKEIAKSLEKDKSWNGEFKNLTKDKKTYWLEVSADAKMKDGKVFCYNYIMHNITARKQKEEMSYIDELTNAYNRKSFNDIFPRMVHNIKRNGGCVNFIILDVDYFKKYNEIYGIQKGDEALVKISTKLKESLRRPDDYCFRLGGGEFGLLYRSKSEDEGYLYAQVLKKNIEMLGIKHEENRKYKVLTVSLGIVSREKDRIHEDQEIYTLAYEHLARAKADGRNKVVRDLV